MNFQYAKLCIRNSIVFIMYLLNNFQIYPVVKSRSNRYYYLFIIIVALYYVIILLSDIVAIYK